MFWNQPRRFKYLETTRKRVLQATACGNPGGVLDDGQIPDRGLVLRSVDVELVAFRVLHPDRVVVEPFLGQWACDGGAQAGQPTGLRVDSLPASLDRVRPLATG